METKDSLITQKCRNFKKYLQRRFRVKNFGNFICASTFSIAKFNDALEEANKANEEPVFFRIYYGCEDEAGKNHALYIAFLDEQGNVIDTDQLSKVILKQESKCPPGDPCSNDRHFRSINN